MLRIAILACLSLVFSSLVSAQSPPRPKIYGIAFVRIKSSDFQKSSETYSKILCLTSGTNGCVNVKNPCFVVNAVQHVELTHADASDSGSWLEQVAFRTDNVEQMRDYLRAQGLLVSEIQTTPNGKPLILTEDPEGNHIAFVQLARGETIAPLSRNQVSYRLFHAGFVVRDLQLMRHFYMDQLGFRLYWKGGFKDLPADAPKRIPTSTGLRFRCLMAQTGSNLC